MTESDMLKESQAERDSYFDDIGEKAYNSILFGVGACIGLVGVAGSYFSAWMAGAVRTAERLGNEKVPNAIPSESDMIRFELRDTFRDEIFPSLIEEPASSSFKLWMKTKGYDEYWANKYWAAHWELPSIQQGFEMLHRLRGDRVPASVAFEKADMDRLLKQSDVLPYYRERLSYIAYEPLTRVDLRRMYQLNELDEKELIERYQDLGYNETDAQRLARFAVKDTYEERLGLSQAEITTAWIEDIISDDEFNSILNELIPNERGRQIYAQIAAVRKTRQDKPATDRALTKADVVAAFENEILTRPKALEYLIKLGYDQDESEILLKLKEATSKKLKKSSP